MRLSICPTVTAQPDQYAQQLDLVKPLASRLHIDVGDGKFEPGKITKLDQIDLPQNKKIDLHMMYQRPFTQLRKILALEPNLVIVHAEAEGYFIPFAHVLHKYNIAVGIALLPDTSPHEITPALPLIDHVMIFSGKLGYHGGRADLKLIEKVRQLKILKSSLEIGWDGGINDKNIAELVAGGVTVLNVGGYISKAKNPQAAYDKLKALAE